MNKKSGFTLAEVLVTLMIIGVIAAMTIPSLQEDARRRGYVAGCKKAYSTITNAVTLTEQNEGPLRTWNWNDPDEIIDNVRKNLNLQEYCGEDKSKNCFADYNYSGRYRHDDFARYAFAHELRASYPPRSVGPGVNTNLYG